MAMEWCTSCSNIVLILFYAGRRPTIQPHRDFQYNFCVWFCKHRKPFLPLVSVLMINKNTLLLMDRKGRRWGQLLLRIQQERLKVGLEMFPGALGCLGCVVWNPHNTVLCHNPKGLQNVVVITCKCNLYSAGGRFFGTYFKKLLDMMSISTLLEPLNILSGNPASESLLLWRYTDLLKRSKRWSSKDREIGSFCLLRESFSLKLNFNIFLFPWYN